VAVACGRFYETRFGVEGAGALDREDIGSCGAAGGARRRRVGPESAGRGEVAKPEGGAERLLLMVAPAKGVRIVMSFMIVLPQRY